MCKNDKILYLELKKIFQLVYEKIFNDVFNDDK